MKRFLILAGYCQLSMYLTWSGRLDQYINTRYSYLTWISMALAFILAVVQLVLWVRENEQSGHSRMGWGASLALFIPIFLGFALPNVTLNSTTVAAKGYYFPLAAGASDQAAEQDGQTIQYLKPDTSLYFTQTAYQKQMKKLLAQYQEQDTISITNDNYMEVMELIYLYPDDFVGKTVSYTGFVYNDPTETSQLFLFRFGIIHCIADSGVYGLLTKGETVSYADNTWVHVTGQVTKTYNDKLQQNLPTLEVTSSVQVAQPDNPYVYRVFY